MITKEQAITLRHNQELYFLDINQRISRARVSGKCKIWKRAKEDFRVPVKYGLYENGYLHCEVVPYGGPDQLARRGNWQTWYLTLEEAIADNPKADVQKGLR